jgi:hypothetical protein
MWIRPSIGLFFGVANVNDDRDSSDSGKTGGIVVGDYAVQIGGLAGGLIGFGEKFGVYTGVNGAVSLIPFLGLGFIGIPVGIHFHKSWGLGIIIPVIFTEWWVGALTGAGTYYLAKKMSRN